jgi:hypothetical protein
MLASHETVSAKNLSHTQKALAKDDQLPYVALQQSGLAALLSWTFPP